METKREEYCETVSLLNTLEGQFKYMLLLIHIQIPLF